MTERNFTNFIIDLNYSRKICLIFIKDSNNYLSNINIRRKWIFLIELNNGRKYLIDKWTK